MAKRPIVVDTTTDSPLAAIGVHLAKDVPIPKADAPRLASTGVFRLFCVSEFYRDWVAGNGRTGPFASFVVAL